MPERKRSMQFTKECLYDMEWQMLRMSCLGHWNEQDLEKTLTKLDVYMAQCSGGVRLEYYIRNWRCLNLLNAVKLAWGSRAPLNKQFLQVSADACSSFHNAPGNWMYRPEVKWDWDKVQVDIRSKTYSVEALTKLKMNLMKRYVKMTERNTHGWRPELEKFMDMLDREIATRSTMAQHLNGAH